MARPSAATSRGERASKQADCNSRAGPGAAGLGRGRRRRRVEALAWRAWPSASGSEPRSPGLLASGTDPIALAAPGSMRMKEAGALGASELVILEIVGWALH